MYFMAFLTDAVRNMFMSVLNCEELKHNMSWFDHLNFYFMQFTCSKIILLANKQANIYHPLLVKEIFCKET